ncbi:MAG: hypothetical protein IK078_00085, partial [Lachnospiraceae bacterium]|nr:hypothetical protein [Lachnospiraceae bacterium]
PMNDKSVDVTVSPDAPDDSDDIDYCVEIKILNKDIYINDEQIEYDEEVENDLRDKLTEKLNALYDKDKGQVILDWLDGHNQVCNEVSDILNDLGIKPEEKR